MGGELIDQRQLDRSRGFFAGVAYVLANVDNAEAAFQDALEKAQRYEGD